MKISVPLAAAADDDDDDDDNDEVILLNLVRLSIDTAELFSISNNLALCVSLSVRLVEPISHRIQSLNTSACQPITDTQMLHLASSGSTHLHVSNNVGARCETQIVSAALWPRLEKSRFLWQTFLGLRFFQGF